VIEFALTLPFFLALFLGVVDYGWLYATQSGLDSAVTLACREGAMVDAEFGSPRTVAETELTQRASPWCDGKGCSIAVVSNGAVPDRGLECSVTLPYDSLVGFVPMPNQLSASAIYRLEWQRTGPL